jgi:pyruvate,water dikinase
MAQEERFPSPAEVLAKERIPGTEGWERMYPYFYLFSDDRKEFEAGQMWVWDSIHWPDPVCPFDLVTDSWWLAHSGNVNRVFAAPPARGFDHRLINGYVYISPIAVTDINEIQERVPLFVARSRFYYEHWNQLYEEDWVPKMTALLAELKKIEFRDLPKYEPESVILEHKGINSGYLLLETYNSLIQNMLKAWTYHFEFLALVYVAYVTFYDFCVKAFPGISPNTIAKMVAGAPGLMMFRPDEELGKLAKLAVHLGVADVFKQGLPPEELISKLQTTDPGKRWLEVMEMIKDPWFYVSTGTGFYHTHIGWIDDLSVPFDHIRGHIQRVEKGESIDRPVEKMAAERERLRKEYRELLPTDEDKTAFDQAYETLATAYPYAENHIFYVEHWHFTLFWQKVRQLGRVLVNAGFFKEVDDIFYFYHTDIPPMLLDLVYSWAVSCPARGPAYWRKEVEWRKGIIEKFRTWAPPPALGPVPEKITEPFIIQLYGITSETIESWLAPKPKPEEVTELKGFPASAGAVEGTARVMIEVEKLRELEPGDILVCPCTSPSWGPAFAKIKAAVTDLGGMSSHAAIVCREYGLPAVVGTGFATKIIKTGDKLKVDGATGIVTIVR